MCKFLSALVLKNGDILCKPEASDSHEDLIEHFGLSDQNQHLNKFVRVEFCPPNDVPLYKVKEYVLRVDEREAPGWWTEKIQEKATRKLRVKVKGMLVNNKKKLLLGGCYILYDKAEVEKAVNATIKAMYGSSQVGEMYGSSRVGVMYNSSQVGEMYGSSRVEVMHDSSRVGEMYGSSQVGVMYGSSRVGDMYNSSQVGEMYGSSQVGEMHDSSQVGEMYGSSRVEMMYNSSQVGVMYGSSQVGVMYNSSRVGVMGDSSQVGVMHDSSQVTKDTRKKE